MLMPCPGNLTFMRSLSRTRDLGENDFVTHDHVSEFCIATLKFTMAASQEG